MSWIDKIQDQLIITCGDGKEFRPSWINASKDMNFNVSLFEFPNIKGTLVKRGTPIGKAYNLQIFFQGGLS